jgi:hypothetical protein
MALTRISLDWIEDQIRAGALLEWASDVGYSDVPSFAVGSDDIVYKSTTPNGVDVDGNDIGPGAIDPSTDTTGVWEEFATGGATGGGRDKAFIENDSVITNDYTITTGRNAVSVGPMSVGVGLTVTSIVSDGIKLTIDTLEDHNMQVGDEFSIINTTNYNGTYNVDVVVDENTIEALSAINTAAEVSGTVTKKVVVTVPNDSVWVVI